MTKELLNETLATVVNLWKVAAIVIAMLSAGLAVASSFIWTTYGDSFKTLVTEDIANDVQEIRVQVAGIDRSLGTIAQAVEILGKPRVIADFSGASRYIGPCYVGEFCVFAFRVRRFTETKDCKLIDDLTEHTVMSFEDYLPRRARVDHTTTAPSNISDEFRTIEIDVELPESLPPGEAQYTVKTVYRCPWQSETDRPIEQLSPAILFHAEKRELLP